MNFKKCAFKKPKWNKVSWPIPLSFRWSPWWPGTYNSKDHIFLFVDLPQTFPPIHGSTSRSPGTDPPLPALGWESHSDASSVDPLNLNSTLKTPSLIFILQPITSLEVTVGEKSNLCQGSDHSWTFIPHTVISQPPVSIQESMSWFLFLFLHTQSFSRVPCYLTNDRNPQHPCQVLAMNWFPFLSFFHFFFPTLGQWSRDFSVPRFGVSPTFQLYCPTESPTVFVGGIEIIKIHLVLSLQKKKRNFILLPSPSCGIWQAPISLGVSEQMNDNNVLSSVPAVPHLVPSGTKSTGFQVKGLSQVSDAACCPEQEQTCVRKPGAGFYGIACDLPWTKAAQISKTLQPKVTEKLLSETLAESNHGSLMVVQCQPRETKRLIKISLWDEKENPCISHFLFL